MKRRIVLLCAVMLLVPFARPGSAEELTTRTKDGITYTCVNSKAAYYETVRRAIDHHEEQVYVYYESDKREWDDSYSNDGTNFTHYNTQTQFDDFSDYNADSVCVTITSMNTVGEGGSSQECWGTIDVTYIDTKDELAKADKEIRSILSGISSKNTADQLRWAADYVCQKAQYGSQELPGGGYDRINGVFDVLSGIRTNTVCTSYALTMMRFMDIMEVNNVLLSNPETVHVWNMVELDGKWYGIDCTFEDGTPGSYVLMGYDRLKQYDSANYSPVETFAKNHNIASTGYKAVAEEPVATKRPTSPQATGTAKTETDMTKPDAGTTTSAVAPTSGTSVVPSERRVDIAADSRIKPEIFAQAAEDGVDLVLEGDGYRWLFTEEALRGVRSSQDFDAAIRCGEKLDPAQRGKIEQAAGQEDIYPFAFSHHGELPAAAEIRIRVADQYAGKQVYVYYLDEDNQPQQAAVATVTEDAFLTFSTDHCSLWFVSEQMVVPQTQSGSPVWIWILCGVGAAAVLAGAAVVMIILLKRRVQKAD